MSPRPREGYQGVTVRVEDYIANELTRRAADQDRSVSAVVRRILTGLEPPITTPPSTETT